MDRQLVLLMAALGLFMVALAQEGQDDSGTVIGIDLGTTYSWLVILLSVRLPTSCPHLFTNGQNRIMKPMLTAILTKFNDILYNYFIPFCATVKTITHEVLWMTRCTVAQGRMH